MGESRLRDHVYFNLYSGPGYLDFIDINMTFYMQSQVPITFTCMWGGGKLEDLLLPPPPKTKGFCHQSALLTRSFFFSLDKCVVFMATKCASGGATGRTDYVRELMQHLDIHSYGKCLHNKDLPLEMQFPIYRCVNSRA